MIRVHLFGNVDLRNADGAPVRSVLAQPKRTALLAYLAATGSGRLTRRATLLSVFWPDVDDARARNALSKALHHLRRSLGKEAIVARGTEELGLAVEHVWCDVVAFERAIAAGEHAAALDLYARGPLLDGFALADSPEFDHWLDTSRARLEREARTAAEAVVGAAEARGDPAGATENARRAVALFPYDEPLLRRLLTLLDRGGDRAGAVRAYREFVDRLGRELELEPAAETEALARAIETEPHDGAVVRPQGAPLEARTEPEAPVLTDSPGAASTATVVNGKRAARRPTRLVTFWGGSALILALLLVSLGLWLRPRSPEPDPTVRMTVALSPGVRLPRDIGVGLPLAVSPDGRTIVVLATDSAGQRLYVRSLDRLEATPVAGSEGAASPFFSPDGTWIGFYQDGRLRRVPAAGGAVVDIAAAPGLPLGASWGADDRIVFASGFRSALHVVSARGGEVGRLTTLDADLGEVSHRHPELLPDGRTLLFVSFSPPDPQRDWIHALDLRTGRRAPVTAGTNPRYSNGHLLLAQGAGTALLAAPFDPSRLELSGDVVPVVDNVAIENTATMHYAVSRDGTLAYVPGDAEATLVLIAEDGSERVLAAEGLASPGWPKPRFSPDGARIAVSVRRGGRQDVWVRDLASGEASRLTYHGGGGPTWTPDGSAITFGTDGVGLSTVRADGRGEAERLIQLERWAYPLGWTPDGRTLAFARELDDGSTCLAALSDGEHRCVVTGTFIGSLSRDGRWLAYSSNESGRPEVSVTAFPEGAGRWLISAGAGSEPVWDADGTEIYYRDGDRLVAAGIDTTAGVRVVSRRTVLDPYTPTSSGGYDVHPDGGTIAVVRPLDARRRREVVVVLNWSAELR